MDELIVKDIRNIHGNTIVTVKCTNCGLEEYMYLEQIKEILEQE